MSAAPQALADRDVRQRDLVPPQRLAAAEQVVPVAATASEAVRRLRSWAAGRCLDAGGGGLYVSRIIAEGNAAVPVTRRVDRSNGRN